MNEIAAVAKTSAGRLAGSWKHSAQAAATCRGGSGSRSSSAIIRCTRSIRSRRFQTAAAARISTADLAAAAGNGYGRRMIGTVRRLTFTQKWQVWQFPKDRFVEWGPEDESYCRLAGYGRDVEKTQTITIPRALITGVTGNSVSFTALPDNLGDIAWPK